MPLAFAGENYVRQQLEKLMYSETPQIDPRVMGTGRAVSSPAQDRRSLIESRNSLVDGLDHLIGTINMCDALLDTLRGSHPSANEKTPMPTGAVAESFSDLATLYSQKLNQLRRRIEEFDSVIGAGFASPAAPTRG
jgi:hypothetical protein